ncbi:MAG: BspA family leucine-rich repeat surface protein, partial [Halobacteriovoraceae bacterium]|nr:BspA family leucine-rich repeat surface protein [Halobacteriovoraceae bacterium]
LPPIISNIADETVNELQAITQINVHDDITGNDTDRDGDTITYTCYWDNVDDDAVASVNQCAAGGSQLPGTVTFAAGGVLDWTPTYGIVGAYEIKIVASEGDLSDTLIFQINVSDIDLPPDIAALSNETVNQESAITQQDANDVYTGNDLDRDGDAIGYTCWWDNSDNDSVTLTNECDGSTGVGLPGTFNLAAGGVIDWTPDYTASGTYELMIIGDEGDLTDTEYFTITVNDIDLPPIMPSIADEAVNQESAITQVSINDNVTGTDNDRDGDAITYTCWWDTSDNDTVVQTNECNGSTGSALPGTFNMTAAGVLDWTPNYIASGTYELMIIGDEGDLSDAAYFTITVNDIDLPPVMPVVSDESVNQESAITQVSINDDVTGTDNDRDGDAITYTCWWDTSDNDSVTQTNECDGSTGSALPGTFNMTAAGVLNWTPDYTASGTYELMIIGDEGDLDDTAYFTITVNDIDLPPVMPSIADETVNQTNAITQVDVNDNVTGNDNDRDGDAITYACWWDTTDNDSVTQTNECDGSTGSALPGTFNLTASGVLDWTPDHTASGTYELMIIGDEGDLDDTAYFTLNVNDIDLPPIIASISDETVNETTAITQVNAHDNVTGNDTDRDGDAITYTCFWDNVDDDSVASVNQCATGGTQLPGSVTFAAGGILDWTPDAGSSGAYEIKIIASEGDLTDTFIFQINVSDIDLPPELISVSDEAVNQESAITQVDVNDTNTGNDTDRDGDAITYTCWWDTTSDDSVTNTNECDGSTGSALPGTFNMTVAGVIDWTPDYTASGTYELKVVGSEGDLSDTLYFTITVNNIDLPPVMPTIADEGVNQESAITQVSINDDVTGTDNDRDGDAITYTCWWDTSSDDSVANTNECDGSTGSALPGTFNMTAAGVLDWTPNYTASGTYELMIIASEGDLTDVAYFTITVNDIDFPPVMPTIADEAVNQESAITQVSINDDVTGTDNDRDGDAITYTCWWDTSSDDSVTQTNECDGSTGSAVPGTFNMTAAGVLDWTPDYTASGTYELMIIADEGDLTDVTYFTITVNNIDLPPELVSVTDNSVDQASAMTQININDTNTGNDTDRDGDTITYTCWWDASDDNSVTQTNKCDGSTGSAIPGTFNMTAAGVIDWTPAYNISGTYEFMIIGNEGDLTDTIYFTITVNDVDLPPVLSTISDTNVDETVALTTINAEDTYTSSDADRDSETIGYTCYYDTTVDGAVANVLSCGAIGVSFSTTLGTFDWTPAYGTAGDYEFKIVGTAGVLSGEEIFVITVNDIDLPPVLSTISPETVAENSAITQVDAQDDFTSSDNDRDAEDIDYVCYFDNTSDDSVATTNACTTLPGSVTWDASNGVLDWTPDYTAYDGGPLYEIRITGTSGVLSDDEFFDLTITNVNRDPVLDTIDNQLVSDGVAITTINAADGGDDQDIDLDTLNYNCYYDTTADGSVGTTNSCASLTGVSWNGTTGVLDWTPSSQAGEYEFSIVADDGLGGTDDEIFVIEVYVAADAFISSWQTSGASESITIPLGGTVDVTIDWGDGAVESFSTANPSHVYATANTYTITITGSANSLSFNNTGDKDKILTVPNLGDLGWTDFQNAFYGCSNLTTVSGGNTTAVTRMDGMFRDATNVVPDTSGWNTSNVVYFTYMFKGTTAANPDTSSWDTSSATHFNLMFQQATAANPNTSGWNTSAATTFYYMFQGATSANPDTSGWNTSNVTNMGTMFNGATSANPNVSGWDTAAVTNMSGMFYNSAANPDMSGWNVGNVTNMTSIFGLSAISIQNYSAFLVMAEATSSQNSVALGGVPVCYNTSAIAARTDLTGTHSWTMSDCFNDAPSLVAISDQLVADGNAITAINAADTNSGNDTDVDGDTLSYTCYYDTTIDGSVSTTNTCASLTGVTWDSPVGSGTMTWTPSTQIGDYEFKIIADDSNGNTDEEIFVIQVYDGAAAFISTWQTTSPSESITLPLRSGYSYNFTVDWGDGSTTSVVTSDTDPDITHIYASAGTYTVTINGLVESWFFNNSGDKDKILTVPQLGNVGWVMMTKAFNGCSNLTTVTGGDTSLITSMYGMFEDAPNAVPDTSGWDTSSLVTANNMFLGATSANPDTSGWDTSNVTSMAFMFYNASNANPDVSGWNTASVSSMERMFYGASSATPVTSTSGNIWNTSNVSNMRYMFGSATNANPDTSGWDTSSVTLMDGMFRSAGSANPNVSGWNVTNVTNMAKMFESATSATPNTSSWNTGNVTNMESMFSNATSANPDVSGWDVTSVTNMNYMFKDSNATPNTSSWVTTSLNSMVGIFWNASNANPDVDSWNVSNVTSMNAAFLNASSANPDMSSWNVGNVTSMANMLSGSGTSVVNYSNFLIAAEASSSQSSVALDATGICYNTSAISARGDLTGTHSWTINDCFNGAPDLVAIDDQLVADGSAIVAINATDTNSGNDTDVDGDTITYTCYYDTTIDGSVGTTNTCASLTGVTWTAGPGTITWIPSGQIGDYEFKIIADDSNGNTDEEIFVIQVYDGTAAFISTWQTTTPSESITLPLRSGYTYNFTVDWGDSSGTSVVTSDVDPDITHTYSSAGTYTVTISGTVEAWYFNNSGDKDKILTVPQLGSVGWTNLNQAFSGCTNLTTVSGGDTSSVTSMGSMFYLATNAVPDTSGWDTSNVTNMASMFYDAPAANPNTSGWNTSNVTSMSRMFRNATNANPDVSGWSTANVTDMSFLFSNASSATPNTSGWNTTSVTTMKNMFYGATNANPDVSSWNVSNVTDMSNMFINATNANPDMSSWNVGNVTTMASMLNASGTSVINYSNLLIQAEATSSQNNVVLGASGICYNTSAITARTDLVTNHTWTITDCENHAPELEEIIDQLVADGNAITGINAADLNTSNDTDQDTDTLSYTCYYDITIDDSVGTSNTCASLTGVIWDSPTGTGTLTWTPSGQVGEYEFKIIADDGQGNTDEEIFIIEVYDATNAFISTWQTTAPSESITLPLRATYSYDFTVDWGDGTSSSYVTSDSDPDKTHIYASAGTYTVTITGTVQAWYFNNSGDKDKILTVPNLGSVGWTDLKGAFYGCSNLTTVSGGDTSTVTNMDQMFMQATNATPNTSGWNTSSVTSMYRTFMQASSANPDVSGWDVSSVTNMSDLFNAATSATPDVSSWNVISVQNMSNLFRNASSANPNVGSWVTTSATNMSGMFRGLATNPDVDSFNTANVTNLSYMFKSNTAANPDVSSWNTSSVTTLQEMFSGASSADPDMSSWNIGNVTDMTSMLDSSGTSIINYSNFLIQAEATSNQNSVVLGASGICYNTTAITARGELTGTHSWTITDCFNDAPDLIAIGDQMVDDGVAIVAIDATDTNSGNDTDIDGDTISYLCYYDTVIDGSVSNLTDCSILTGVTFDAPIGQGNMTWTPSSQVGDYEFKIIANDPYGNSDEEIFSIRVIDLSNAFVSTWQTTGASETITLPLPSGFAYNFTVDWGDGTSTNDITAYNDPDITHTYATANTYTMTVTGSIPAWSFNGAGDKDKILTVPNLGNVGWVNFSGAFKGCANLTTVSGGNTAAVTNMFEMFRDAPNVTPDTSGWNTANVTNFGNMFRFATSAVPDTSSWDTSSATTLNLTFYGATNVNPDVSGWDTSNVTNMYGTFFNATSATPDVSGWVTTSVTNMQNMFRGASNANPDMSSWNVGSVTNMGQMLDGSGTSVINYSNLLIQAEATSVQNNVTLGNGICYNTTAISARADLVTNHTWTIVDCFNDAPDLVAIVDQLVDDGNAITAINATDTNSGNDTDTDGDTISYTCYYDTTIDDAVTNTTACGTLTGVTFDSPAGSGTMTWTPSGQVGDYEFKIVADDGNGNIDEEIFWIKVQDLTNAFVSTWQTTGASETITLPLRSGFTYDFYVDWGDGSTVDHITTYNQAEATHTYATANTYTVTITGTVESWFFNNAGDKDKILTIPNLGAVGWKNLNNAFWGCSNLTTVAGGDTSSVVGMQDMFRSATNVTPDTSGWDTSNVTNMKGLFNGASSANPDVSNWNTVSVTRMDLMFYGASSATPTTATSGDVWNTSNVTTFYGMFYGASNANPDTSGWVTTSATNLGSMFRNASNANPDTSSWNTSNVTEMSYMFTQANNANPDVSGWDVSNVTNMANMFYGNGKDPDVSSWVTTSVTNISNMFASNSTANPDVSGWNVSGVTNMSGMFWNASSANPDLSSWNVGNVTNMTNMFSGSAGISTINYSNFLIQAEATSSQSSVTLDAASICYNTTAVAARADLTGTHSWTINDCFNDAPDLVAIADQLVDDGSAITAINATDTNSGNDTDIDGDTISYNCYYDMTIDDAVTNTTSCSSLAGVTFDSPAGSGTLTWTPSGQIGHYEFKIVADDGFGNIDEEIFYIVVQDLAKAFISTWQTTGASETITLPLRSGYTYDFYVDWGDGSAIDHITAYNQAEKIHTYATANTYTVNITGTMQTIFFNNGGDKDKILTIPNLGDVGWVSLEGAFHGCSNLTTVAGGNTSAVVSMSNMFNSASNVTPDVSGWDTSNVAGFSGTFKLASSAVPDVSGWDTSSAVSMFEMFWGANSATTLDVSGFNTSNVTNMSYMFRNVGATIIDVSSWDTSSVTAMQHMFRNVGVATLDVSNFDTSNVTNMSYMFYGVSNASPNVSGFVTTNVTNMSYMFKNAANTNPDMSSWNVGNVTNMTEMLNGSGISVVNYSNLLIQAEATSSQNGVVLDAAGKCYNTSAVAARADLTGTHSWTITDCFNDAPDLVAINYQYVEDGSAIVGIDATDTNSGNDTDIDGDTISYTCTFDTTIDDAVAAGADCSTLTNATWTAGPGTLTWTPSSQVGDYEFKIVAADVYGNSDTEIFWIRVRNYYDGVPDDGFRAFITEGTALDIATIAGDPDLVCANRAATSGFSGNYEAIVSTDSLAASSKITGSGPVYLLKPGNEVALVTSDVANLFAGTGLDHPINRDRDASAVEYSSNVWTGSTNIGAIDTGNTCTSYTSTTGNARIGKSHQYTGGSWLSHSTLQTCSGGFRLYCIRQEIEYAPDIAGHTVDQDLEPDVAWALDIDDNTTGNDLDQNGDDIDYFCKYDLVVDGSVSSPSDCDSITGVTFDTDIGEFAWTPTSGQVGQYEFKVVADDGKGNTEEDIFVLDVAPPFAGGDGTSGDPYQIADENHLNNMADYPTAYFKLNNDIDLSGQSYTPPSSTFSGNFDGNDKTIYNWTDTSGTTKGFFGPTVSGNIHDLTLLNINLDSTGTGTVGAITGSLSSAGVLANIYVTGTVIGASQTGGLIGYCNSSATSTHLHFRGSVQGSNFTGGIIGAIYKGTIQKISSYGTIIGNDNVGGIIGGGLNVVQVADVSEAYNFAYVEGNSDIGGIVGDLANGNVQYSVNRGDIYSTSTGFGNVGGIVGYIGNISNAINLNELINTGKVSINSATISGLGNIVGNIGTAPSSESNNFFDSSTSELSVAYGSVSSQSVAATGYTMPDMKDTSNFSALNVTYWSLVTGEYPTLKWRAGNPGGCNTGGSPFGGGVGAAYDPYQICSLSHLEQLDSYADKDFILLADIDMTGTSYTASTSFTGNLQGNYYELSNYTSTTTDSTARAMFNSVDVYAVVEDLFINKFDLEGREACAITTDLENYSMLSNIKVSNSIFTTNGTGQVKTGGIIGYAKTSSRGYDLHMINSTVESTYATPTSERTGGIIGHHGTGSAGFFRRLTFSGVVSGYTNVGGIVGLWDSGEMEQVASNAYVKGYGASSGDTFGGIVGSVTTRHLKHFYFEGRVDANDNYGGIAGDRNGATGSTKWGWTIVQLEGGTNCDGAIVGTYTGGSTFTDVYADTDLSNSSDLDGCGTISGASGQTTSYMQTASNFSSWDSTIWTFRDNDHPRFTWDINSCPVGYSLVPGDSTIGTTDYCIMTYPAKNVSGVPTSQTAGTPWTSISGNNSYTECDDLNTDLSGYTGTFAMITNPEWMTAARNAENVDENWSSGTVGSGCLFRGNNGTNDSCGYDGSDPEYGTGRNTKAMLIFSNGQTVWDMAGNGWEWVDWSGSDSSFTVASGVCSGSDVELNTVSCGVLSYDDYMPDDNTLTSTNGVGTFYSSCGSGGAVSRGHNSSGGANAGIYQMDMCETATGSHGQIGFRCVYHLP